MSYSNPQDIWKNLGKDAYTKIRSEIVGTGNTTTSTWELDHDNVISDSTSLYTNSVAVPTSSYSLDLDDGSISGLTLAAQTLSADYDYGDLPDSMIQQMISSSDSLIDTETGRSFSQNTANIEYLNVEESQRVFFLKNYPVITLSSVEVNTEVQTSAPNWSASASGLGNDYIANSEDLVIGRIRFIDNFPNQGEDNLKVTYDYGYSTVPPLAQELSTLLTLRQMANSSVYKSIFKGHDNFTPVRLDEINNRIEELKRILKKQSIELI
jgi:hypothetical protein